MSEHIDWTKEELAVFDAKKEIVPPNPYDQITFDLNDVVITMDDVITEDNPSHNPSNLHRNLESAHVLLSQVEEKLIRVHFIARNMGLLDNRVVN